MACFLFLSVFIPKTNKKKRQERTTFDPQIHTIFPRRYDMSTTSMSTNVAVDINTIIWELCKVQVWYYVRYSRRFVSDAHYRYSSIILVIGSHIIRKMVVRAQTTQIETFLSWGGKKWLTMYRYGNRTNIKRISTTKNTKKKNWHKKKCRFFAAYNTNKHTKALSALTVTRLVRDHNVS